VVVTLAGVTVTVGVVVAGDVGEDVQPALRIPIIITDKTSTTRKELFKDFMEINRKCDPI
jgi:hypothetical protein